MTNAEIIADLEAQYTAVLQAYLAASKAEEYSIAGRSKKMASIETYRQQMNEIRGRIARLTNGCGTSVEARITPHGS